MTDKRQNCWEYTECGREPSGSKVKDLGVCIASTDASYDGINSGSCAGRICWAVAGTFCGGKVQGTFSEKRQTCLKCGFYKKVQEEEGSGTERPKFLRYISQEDKNPIFEKMTYKHIKAGTRFVFQGEVEDTAYIIQRGSCLVIVEKEGRLYPVDHYGQGDIVGGLGILTGEPRRAHVEAETDMDLWVIKKDQFEDVTAKDPDLLHFLTELIADRFDSRRPTAYRTIGKYVADNIIGRGGYSIVYRGINKRLNLPVAIKMMRHNMATDQEFMAGFLNEAKTIAGLNHENIVKVYDIEERYRTLFIIMEYVEGDSLEKMIARLKRIPPVLAANFLSQICRALEYAHERGIIHRDINPTNIIIQRNDRLKILDFGLACSVGTEDFGNFGTAYYMAPEQIQGEPVDFRTDIYALGVTAYEMVTGQKPFSESELKALLHSDFTQKIPDPHDLVPTLPEELRRFILKATRKAPEERYQSATEALEDLKLLIKDLKIIRSNLSFEERKMSTFFLIYKDEHQIELNRLIDEFTSKLQTLGVDLKIADFRDA